MRAVIPTNETPESRQCLKEIGPNYFAIGRLIEAYLNDDLSTEDYLLKLVNHEGAILAAQRKYIVHLRSQVSSTTMTFRKGQQFEN